MKFTTAIPVAILWLLSACSQETESPVETAALPQFVGSATCADCHDSQFRSWENSHHKQAIQPANDATVLGDFNEARFEYFGHETKFTQRDGDFFVTTDDENGNTHEYRIEYTFGVTPLQQYLVRFPGGRMQALPFSWDSRTAADGGQRWFHLYPDEYIGPGDELHWTGRYQNWNYMCAECHSTNLEMGYNASDDTFATTFSELPVGCEACHGPGSVHAAQAEREELDDESGLLVDLGANASQQWRMNPSTGIATRAEPALSTPQEIESCARCHSRRSTIAMHYEYGRPLTDTHLPALLDEHLYFSDGQIDEEVYVYGSFLQSRMYEAGVTCSNCHDPHSGSLRTGPDANDVCSQCHLPTRFAVEEHSDHESNEAGCVDCHMTSRTYMGVDDRRDHSFRIPEPHQATETGAPLACTNCHKDKTPEWAALNTRSSEGDERPHYGPIIAAGRQQRANDSLRDAARNETFPAIARATMLSLLRHPLGRDDLAALESSIQDADPLLRIAALRALRNTSTQTRLELAGESLLDPVLSVRIEAALTLADVRDLLPLEHSRAYGEAAEEYRDAYTMLSSTTDALMNLGNFELRNGNLTIARGYFETALQREPTFVAARLNLVDTLRSMQDEATAEALLSRGIELSPDNPALRHSMGLALVRTGQPDQGLEELRLAAQLAPDDNRYVYVLGVALNSLGYQQDALQLMRDAYQRFPGDYDIGWALATMLRDAGNSNEARGIAAKLASTYPDDSNIAALVRALDGTQ